MCWGETCATEKLAAESAMKELKAILSPAHYDLMGVATGPKKVFDRLAPEVAKLQGKPLSSTTEEIFNHPPINKMKWDMNQKCQLYCSRCYNCNAKTTLDELRYKHCLDGLWCEGEVEEGEVEEGEKGYLVGIKVMQLFLHDKDCTTLPCSTAEDLYHRRAKATPGSHGGIQKKFVPDDGKFYSIMGQTFDKFVTKLQAYQDPFYEGPPPGTAIDNGAAGAYDLDDRTYVYVPTEAKSEYHEELPFMELLYFLMRTTALFIQGENFVHQFTAHHSCRCYPPVPEKMPDPHIFISAPAVIFGGHNIDNTASAKKERREQLLKKLHRKIEKKQKERKTHHQICHADFCQILIDGEWISCSDNPQLQHIFVPGSLILALDDYREIYVGSADNIVHIKKGEYYFFQGDTPHGGLTWRYDPTTKEVVKWHPSLHLYVESIYHRRDMEDGGRLEFDADPKNYLPKAHVPFLNMKHRQQLSKFCWDYIDTLVLTENGNFFKKELEDKKKKIVEKKDKKDKIAKDLLEKKEKDLLEKKAAAKPAADEKAAAEAEKNPAAARKSSRKRALETDLEQEADP